MKLRLTADGYTDFTGLFGIVEFQDGLSVEDVSPKAAGRIGAVISTTWEDGTTASVADAILNGVNVPAPSVDGPYEHVEFEQTGTVGSTASYWTAEELGAIADESGIAGLRVIAEPAGVKGNSIAGLIAAILKANVVKGE